MPYNLSDSLLSTQEMEKSFELIDIFTGDMYLPILKLIHGSKGIVGGRNQWDAEILASIDYNGSRLSSSGQQNTGNNRGNKRYR